MRLIRKTDITDRALSEAVDRAGKGLIDVELGSVLSSNGFPGEGRDVREGIGP